MKKSFKRFWAMALVLVLVLTLAPSFGLRASATDLTGLTVDKLSASYTAAANSGSVVWAAAGDKITGSVVGKKTTSGSIIKKYEYAAEETTLTLTNGLGAEGVLQFDYECVDTNGTATITVNGTAITGSGSYSVTVADKGTVVIKLGVDAISNRVTDKPNGAAITLSNLDLHVNVTNSVTFLPATNGSYTVDGTAITASKTVKKSSADNYALAATPADGYSFGGWYCEDCGAYLAGLPSVSIAFAQDHTIVPHFIVTADATFGVGDYRFNDLTAAGLCAKQGTDKQIKLLKNATITGSHNIPTGVTLLIPFDSAYTCYTDTPACVGSKTTFTASAYRTLTLAAGASIEVDGAISVSAQHSSGNSGQAWAGSPYGPYGHIAMNTGSSIKLNSGAKLYAWGYITGDGTITANSGSTVYENIQVTDFRGGSAILNGGILDNTVFPFSQYYVQNIEVPLTIHYGAAEITYTSIYAMNQDNSCPIDFIGTADSMFQMTEGASVTKDYDPTTDRLIITVDGDEDSVISLSSITVSMTYGFLPININSATFELPINSNITINVNGGTISLGQNVALLPGVRMNIADDATMLISEGSNLYVYDADSWNLGNFVHSNVKFRAAAYSPTRSYTRTNSDLKDVVLDVNGTVIVSGELYTTADGASIISSQETGMVLFLADAGTDTATVQATQSGSTVTFVSIPATAAQLENGDGSNTATAGAKAEDYFYYDADANKWVKAPAAVVSYNGNGAGSGSVASVTISPLNVLYGAEVTVAENGYTYDGHTFTGWNTAANGSGTTYAPGNKLTPTESVTLYAMWDADTYFIYVEDDYIDNDDDLQMDDGEVELAYGDAITDEMLGTPTKEGYTFAGWYIFDTNGDEYDEVPATMPATNLYFVALWEEKIPTYTLTFLDENGDQISSGEYEAGAAIAAPSYAPEGYEFKGWRNTSTGKIETVPSVMPANGLEYQAVTEKITYTITFFDGTAEVGEVTVNYGEEATLMDALSKTGHNFLGWGTTANQAVYSAGQTIEVSGNMTLYAVWSANEYSVTFLDEDGDELSKKTYHYGDTVVVPADPTKAADNTYTYTFAGWTPTVATTVTGDATYTATYDATYIDYTVIFADEDGDVISKKTYHYGNTVVVPADPTKAADNTYTYTFAGWTPTVATTVTGDATYTATYDATYIEYTVIFKDEDGDEISKKTYHYGDTVVVPADPTKEASAEYTYTFAGWSPAVTAVSGDATYTATYTDTANGYTLTVLGKDGETVASLNVAYNAKLLEALTPYLDQIRQHYGDAYTLTEIYSGVANILQHPELTMPAENHTLQAYWSYTGWLTDDNGTTYVVEDEKIYSDEIGEVDGDLYYFDEDGYIVANKGLVKTVNTDGHIHYYYFGCGAENCSADPCQGEYKAQKSNRHYAAITNGYLLEGGYTTGDDGVIEHIDDTSVNGIYTIDGVKYYLMDGVKVAKGLFVVKDDYYYARSSGALVVNQEYWVSKTNGLGLTNGSYKFDAEGRIIFEEPKNGFVWENDAWYYYEDGKLTYLGLVYCGGPEGDDYGYYYVNSKGMLITGCDYWISKNNGIMKNKLYTFDENGTMVIEQPKSGFCYENDAWYYYVDGKLNYAGLIWCDGPEGNNPGYYYVNSKCCLVTDQTYWISKTNDLMIANRYTFDENGKMTDPYVAEDLPDGQVKNGIVKENGSLYYYVDGVLTYAGLIQDENGDYYYVNSRGEVVNGCTYWISKNNGLMKNGSYPFDEDGKMVIG